jgi:hypothetical protein
LALVIAVKPLRNSGQRRGGKEKGWGKSMLKRNEGGEGNKEDKGNDMWRKRFPVDFQQAFPIIVTELQRGGLISTGFFRKGDWVKEEKERILI